MLNKKMISLTLATLGLCSLAVATEYNAPKVLYKAHSPAAAPARAADLGENMKVESADTTDRQIASEEEADRDPSSLTTHTKKKVVEEDKKEKPEEDMIPKPWMYRTNADSQK